ncbi:hypothetical protein [Candidatus Uabimicrobium sp. HlEnr_7]|uniref:hypothetical protein n=1 Tax=Candidatus Uabimicrobium helgolandensis TaxID=3095367 RepID=UPI003556B1C1
MRIFFFVIVFSLFSCKAELKWLDKGLEVTDNSYLQKSNYHAYIVGRCKINRHATSITEFYFALKKQLEKSAVSNSKWKQVPKYFKRNGMVIGAITKESYDKKDKIKLENHLGRYKNFILLSVSANTIENGTRIKSIKTRYYIVRKQNNYEISVWHYCKAEKPWIVPTSIMRTKLAGKFKEKMHEVIGHWERNLIKVQKAK